MRSFHWVRGSFAFKFETSNFIFLLDHAIKVALETVSRSFQHFDLMDFFNHSSSVDATVVVSKYWPIIGQDIGIIFVTKEVAITIATV